LSKSAISVPGFGLSRPDGSSGSLRDAVLAGPGARVQAARIGDPIRAVVTPEQIAAALTAAGHVDKQRATLSGAVTTVLVLGLCLFSGQGSAGVITRLWPLLSVFNPVVVLCAPVCAVALSQARARLPVAVLRELFTRTASGVAGRVTTAGSLVFGLVVTATDGTVFDLAATAAIQARYATPTGGRFPQARAVTVIECGTRRVLAAELDSCQVSEQVLWDRLVACLKPGTINLADRNFFSMHRWHLAAATGAHLAWRVKNGHRSLPAKIMDTLPDDSDRVRLRESDAMLTRRRKTSGEPKAARLDDIIARLVEFTVTLTDRAGKTSTSRFRILTTLLDHDAYPAEQIAALYAERWQAELVYKSIKSTLRGGDPRLRGQSADLAEQEIWALLTVYNALVDHAVRAAVDLGIDPDEISFTTILHATRDHLIASAPCRACGHHRDSADLQAAITAAPRERRGRTRTGPRTKKQRETQHTRDVSYTITITESNLPRMT
jgi:Transposase DDE domain/Insertion element 4 transposase N-terminal